MIIWLFEATYYHRKCVRLYNDIIWVLALTIFCMFHYFAFLIWKMEILTLDHENSPKNKRDNVH